MGLIKLGILGGFRKKTGTVVGAYWRRLDTIRALPRNSGKAPTQAQLNQQLKFKLVTEFLSNVSPLIDVGFKSANSILTPMNLAVAYHLKEAITGLEPNFELDLSKVKFSEGKLDLPLEMTAVAAAGSVMQISWLHTETDDKFVDATDMINLLAYNAVKQKFIRAALVAERSELSYNFQLPANFAGDVVHVYAAFSSVKKKLFNSHSAYLGAITAV